QEKAEQVIDKIYCDPIPDMKYTGKSIKPELKVYDSGTLLKQGTDYTLKYQKNTNAGTAEITIKTKGNYKGTEQVTFAILPQDISDTEAVRNDALSVKLTGKKLSPVPVLYYNGKKLSSKKDYSVTRYYYVDGGVQKEWDRTTKQAQDIYAEVTGKGNYTGTRTVQIRLADASEKAMSQLKVTTKNVTFDKFMELIAQGPAYVVDYAVKVKDGKTAVTNTDVNAAEDGYYIEPGEMPSFIGVGTYRLQVTGKGKYTGDRTVTFKITGTPITDKKIKVNKPVYEYRFGEEIFLDDMFTVTHNGRTLVPGYEYEIDTDTYKKNTEAGTASVVIRGVGAYTGSRTVSFTISPRNESDLINAGTNIIITGDTSYSKGGVKPSVKVKDASGNILKQGKDYTLKYGKNNKAGENTGSVTVVYKGSYKGTKNLTKTFDIAPRALREVVGTAKDVLSSSKAGKYKSTPVLTDTNGKKLKAGIDYEKTYTYEECLITGEIVRKLGAKDSVVAEDNAVYVKVTITGKGNYTGTVCVSYRVMPAGHDISKMTFKIPSKEYTGEQVRLTEDDITIMINKKTEADLKFGTDYYIKSYANNVKTGTATVTFAGIGEYGGTKTVKFKIVKKDVDPDWLGFLN
ncbi:MAG: hypothetical protein IIZ27_09925, partial [Solobacterium sp.]|nr:hypothetical protein [Solobacterium sp.]